MLAAQPRELRATFGPKKPRNAGQRSVSDMCVSAARRLVRGLNQRASRRPRTPDSGWQPRANVLEFCSSKISMASYGFQISSQFYES